MNISWATETKGQYIQPSTGVAEDGGQIILRIECSDMGTISAKEWSSLKDLPEEAAMFSHLFYQAVHADLSAGPNPSADPNPPAHPNPSASENPSAEVSVDLTSTSKATLSDGASMEKALSVISEAVKAKDWDKVKYTLDNFTLVINTDIGGQAEFMDLQASLIQGSSLNLLFSRLVDPLDHQFDEYFTNEKGESTEKERSIMTVEEVLFQALSSIACFSDCFSEEASPEASPQEDKSQSKVMFVGTYRDQVTEEEFKRKDQLLQKKIRDTEFFKRGIVEFAGEDQLMLAVDNMEGGEDEIEKIRGVLERVIEKSFKKVAIPAAWLMLSLKIRSMKVRTMSLGECEELARTLGISQKELQDALWFLHHRIGVLLYYPEVEALKGTVICQIQVVFDSTTNLIKKTFTFGNVGQAVSERFREKAQFFLQDVKAAMSDHTSELLPPEKLVQLLEYLSILTPTPSSGGVSTTQPTYFMPCVLKSARASDLRLPSSSKRDPPPLMLRYDCGYVPVGVFPSLITSLVSSQQANGWEMIEEGLRKNKVQFLVGKNFHRLTLISHPRFIEIAISDECDASTESLCAHVRSVIQSTLNRVTSRMNGKFKMNFKYGFECPNHPGREHLCVLADETADRMLCLQDKKPLSLHHQQKLWFTGSPSPNTSTGIVHTIVLRYWVLHLYMFIQVSPHHALWTWHHCVWNTKTSIPATRAVAGDEEPPSFSKSIPAFTIVSLLCVCVRRC